MGHALIRVRAFCPADWNRDGSTNSTDISAFLTSWLASVQGGRRLKTYFVGLAVILTLLVGCSRVYLGVHWPSDVLAGWAAGASWAIIVWLVARQMRRPREADE